MSADDEEGAAVWRAGVRASAEGILATRVHPPLVAVNGGAWVAVCGEPTCTTADGERHREREPERGAVLEAIALHIARVHWPEDE